VQGTEHSVASVPRLDIADMRKHDADALRAEALTTVTPLALQDELT
jgi:hypothetical protein